MTSDEIRYGIRHNEVMIDECYAEKVKLHKQIDELEMLRAKFLDLRERLSADQQKRKYKVSGLTGLAGRMKMVKRYMTGMNELLSGREFQNAYFGLCSGIERINHKIEELTEQIEYMNLRINYLKARNEMLYDEMRTLDE